MDDATVTEKLIEVLREIQSNSGHETDGFAPETRPLVDLEGFDSLLWPVAISMLATTLGVEIPNNKNIYVSEDGTHPLTIKESAAAVCRVATK